MYITFYYIRVAPFSVERDFDETKKKKNIIFLMKVSLRGVVELLYRLLLKLPTYVYIVIIIIRILCRRRSRWMIL